MKMFELLRVVFTFALVLMLACESSEDPSKPGTTEGQPGTPSEGSASRESGQPTLEVHPGDTPLVDGTGRAAIVDDAGADGWSTEVLSQRTVDALWTALGLALERGDAVDEEALRTLCDSDVSVDDLTATGAASVLQSETISVRRRQLATPKERGVEAFVQAIKDLSKSFDGLAERHVKFKQFHIESDEATQLTSRLYFQASGSSAEQTSQLHAVWDLRWSVSAEGDLKLKGLSASDIEEVRLSKTSGPLFSDITDSLLGAHPIFDTQLRPGVDHWTARLDSSLGLDVGGWQGLCIADVNGDGLDDLYVCQPGGLPNRLFVQKADGSTLEVSAASGVDWVESCHGALFADLDNDGDQDLVVGLSHGILFQENDGKGHFKVRSTEILPAALPYSITSADYDADGDLDLYVCCYNRRQGANQHVLFARPVPYHDANNGGRNVFFENAGPWRFVQATKKVGFDVNNRRYSYASSWEDYDEDGDLDLYVANDFGRNNLYRNDNGRFVDVAPQAGVEDLSPGMSACWGDYDADGRMDLYVSNMFSSAGNRITNQSRFQSGRSETLQGQLRRHARGNSLFRNLGNGEFEDVSVEAGVVLGRWAWGSKFVDLNSDGWEDLIVTNGFITQEDTGDL